MCLLILAANLNRITPIEAETNLPDLPEPGQEQNEAEEQMTVMSIRPTMPQSEGTLLLLLLIGVLFASFRYNQLSIISRILSFAHCVSKSNIYLISFHCKLDDSVSFSAMIGTFHIKIKI